MNKIIWPLLLVLLFSCDFDREQEDEDEGVSGINNLNEYTIGSGAKESRDLTSTEKERGERVCQAFESMRERIKPFVAVKFRLQEKNCLDRNTAPREVFGQIRSFPNESPRMSGANLTFQDVYSDLHPHLMSVCSSLMAGEGSSDTLNMAADRKIQLRFRSRGNSTYVQVYEFNKSILEFIHTIEVGMDSSTEGLSMKRSMSRRCTQRGKVYSFSQDIVSI